MTWKRGDALISCKLCAHIVVMLLRCFLGYYQVLRTLRMCYNSGRVQLR